MTYLEPEQVSRTGSSCNSSPGAQAAGDDSTLCSLAGPQQSGQLHPADFINGQAGLCLSVPSPYSKHLPGSCNPTVTPLLPLSGEPCLVFHGGSGAPSVGMSQLPVPPTYQLICRNPQVLCEMRQRVEQKKMTEINAFLTLFIFTPFPWSWKMKLTFIENGFLP